MPRPVSWFRWYRGKVWHVGFAQDAAACGSERPADAETVGERAPVNARVCTDCVAGVQHLAAMVNQAQLGDPRTAGRGPSGEPGAPLPEIDDVVDAEIHCAYCEHVEHVGLCPGRIEDDPLDEPCTCFVAAEG